MVAVTIRNLPEETHRAIKAMAQQHNKSTEAEIRSILENAVRPDVRVKLGTLLAEIGREIGYVDLDITRDKTPIAPVSFE